MRTNDGLCSLQEYNTFKNRISDAVDEWLNYCDADPNFGISLNPSTLEVEVCDKADTQPGYPRENAAKNFFYGWLYEENGEYRIKLNLQVRFK